MEMAVNIVSEILFSYMVETTLSLGLNLLRKRKLCTSTLMLKVKD